ncbi:MAG: ABC transporter permease, partial [Bacteroidales bacterium]|nr:ABC transporter permease [Bacteroidales bacterium]
GFDNSIKEILESYKADYVIQPAKGKVIDLNQQWYNELLKLECFDVVSPVVEEDIFISYNQIQTIAHAKGVEDDSLYFGEIPHAAVGQNLAYKLGVRLSLNSPLELYYPDKNSQISLSNPTASLNYKRVFPASIVPTEGIEQAEIIYLPLDILQELTGYNYNECSKIELYKSASFDTQKDDILVRSIVPQYLTIKDKLEQDATLNRIIKAEKVIVYLILFFVILIISINVFSSLALLIIDKKEDIETFLALGAKKSTIKQIFYLHGMYICTFGTIVGIVLGIVLSLTQQYFKIISMPGNYIIESYPVDLQFTDVAITFFGVMAISVFVSYLPTIKFFKN